VCAKGQHIGHKLTACSLATGVRAEGQGVHFAPRAEAMAACRAETVAERGDAEGEGGADGSEAGPAPGS